MFNNLRILAIAGVTAALAVPSAAFAETPAYTQPLQISGSCEVRDTAGPDFHVKLCGVTDVDQFRRQLPNNGSSYCTPTSLYNVLHYFGDEIGAPIGKGGVYIADRDPLARADYDPVTQWLGLISLKANGNAQSGSANFEGARAAFDFYTADAKTKGWSFDRGYDKADPATEFGLQLAKRLAHGPAQLEYFRYTKGASVLSGGQIVDTWTNSNGGHAVTVVSAKGSIGSGQIELTLHDPGRAADHNLKDDVTDNYLDTQSAYRLEVVKLTRVMYWTTGESGPEQRSAWELTGDHYEASTRQFVHGINWFSATKP